MGANRAGFGQAGDADYFNSLIATGVVDPAGLEITGIYDKHRLVPFGEFLPLGDLATRLGIRSLVHMPEDFTAGPGPRPLTPKGLPAVAAADLLRSPVPGFVENAASAAASGRSGCVNVSNDAWFGSTSGPLPAPQHRQLSRHRGGRADSARPLPGSLRVMDDGRTKGTVLASEHGVIDEHVATTSEEPHVQELHCRC